MKSGKVTEAQKRASERYIERNPEKNRYLKYRTTARTFVRHHATEEDMAELEEIFKRENPNYEGE